MPLINRNIIVYFCIILIPLGNACSEVLKSNKMLTYEQADSLYNLLDQANYSSMTTELENLNFFIPQDKNISCECFSFKESTPNQPHKYEDVNGNTILHHACNAGHVKLTEKIVNLRNNADYKNNDNETPLFYAQYNTIQLLIDKGASLTHRNKKNQMPLIKQIADDNLLGTKEILRCMKRLPCDILCKAKQLPFSHTKSLNMIKLLAGYAICTKTIAKNQLLIVNNATKLLYWIYSSMNIQPDINIKDHSDNTLLHIAAQNNHSGVALMLLHKNINMYAQNKFRQTALHNATAHAHSEFITLLIHHAIYLESQGNQNAKSLLLEKKDMDGATALMVAIREDKRNPALQLIAAGADIFTYDKFGHTLLHFVKNPVLAQKLIDMKLDVNSKGRYEHTPLHLAANEQVAQIFINNQADIHAKTLDGDSPLHYAKTTLIAKFLIDAGALVDSLNNLNRTPLHCAAKLGNSIRCKLLLDHNADKNFQDLNGNTPAKLINCKASNDFFALENIQVAFGISNRIPHTLDRRIQSILTDTSYIDKAKAKQLEMHP